MAVLLPPPLTLVIRVMVVVLGVRQIGVRLLAAAVDDMVFTGASPRITVEDAPRLLLYTGEVGNFLAWAKENPISRLPIMAKSDKKMRQEGRIFSTYICRNSNIKML